MDIFIEQPLPWVGKGILQAKMKAEGYINRQKKAEVNAYIVEQSHW